MWKLIPYLIFKIVMMNVHLREDQIIEISDPFWFNNSKTQDKNRYGYFISKKHKLQMIAKEYLF